MALRSARCASLNGLEPALERARVGADALLRRRLAEGPVPAGDRAAAVLAWMLGSLGRPDATEEDLEALRSPDLFVGDPEGLWFATAVLHRTGGARWERWCEEVPKLLIPTQVRGRAPRSLFGSWPGADPADDTARLFTTVHHILTLRILRDDPCALGIGPREIYPGGGEGRPWCGMDAVEDSIPDAWIRAIVGGNFRPASGRSVEDPEEPGK